MNVQTEALNLLVRALNAWLTACGSSHRVTAADVVVTIRDNHMFLAFRMNDENRNR